MTTWRTPAGCDTGSCIEVRDCGGVIGIRDGEDPDGELLTPSRAAFSAFVTAAKRGEYDDLTREGAL